MLQLELIPSKEFDRVRQAAINKSEKLSLIADMCRANTLTAVKRAGSGHLGSSLSAMEIVVWLYYQEMNTLNVGLEHPDRDIYFSSKGHDVPGLYSVLFSCGVISKDKLLKLRRLGGLDGHPDVAIPGIEANSGSLGMGISKARGMAWGKRFQDNQGRVFVLTGDGEFQEGQNYEALQGAAHLKMGNLIVILDHNKVQTDKPVSEIVDLGMLEEKFRCFGWYVARCNGHDFDQLASVFDEFRSITDRPKIMIADTIKGCGVSFMEHPNALSKGNGLYPWHAGAPDDDSFRAAHGELKDRINTRLIQLNLPAAILEPVEPQSRMMGSLVGEQLSQGAQVSSTHAVSKEYVADAFGDALVEVAVNRHDFVVLDADLSADCRLRKFELAYPDRFIEVGIAEQDMVSMAGGLARLGLLPVVNSFASFLASRSNEQIYNNATENTKVIYVCHYAGVIPAGPGKSHQSIRDISLFGALPNLTIIQPCNAVETRMAVEYCVNQSPQSCMLRLVIGPSPRIIALPSHYGFTLGKGVALTTGEDAVLFAYGPVMLYEALQAAHMLQERNFHLQVVNMPWLNRVDLEWLRETVDPCRAIFVLEDHAAVGGLGDYLLNALVTSDLLSERSFKKFAVEGYPACGTPIEALRYHALDAASIARRIIGEKRLSRVTQMEKVS